MGSVSSTPRKRGEFSPETAEYLIGTFVGDESFPFSSEFWQKLLELPLNVQWPAERVQQACELLAKNNCQTRHLAKLLFHLACYLQESMSTSGVPPLVYEKAANAVYIGSVFLKHLIESGMQLYLSFDGDEAVLKDVLGDKTIENLVMRNVLNFIASVEVSPNTFLLHLELLNFLIITMSTQLLCGSSPGPNDVNPFLDAAMAQDSDLVGLVVRKLLLNFITRPRVPFNRATYPIFYDGSQSSVLQRVGSAAANIVLLPFSYLVSSSGEGSRNPIADSSLHVLLILIHYHKCAVSEDYSAIENNKSSASDSLIKENPQFSDNSYCKALEQAIDCELDRVDIEGNAHSGRHIKLPFASLFDTLGMCLADEAAVLLLYSLLQGNSAFLEYVLVRTDIDTLLMPILEALYNAQSRTPNQIYMLLIICLILSQDSSFNASIHKLILTGVPWYKERLLHQTNLGSLMVIILIRTVQYNLSKLRDVYLHTTCLATLANMAPHVHRLSAYASQRLVSLFDMLSRKYNKLADRRDNKLHIAKDNSIEGNSFVEDVSTEMQIYTDFLRLVLEIINAILTYALPRNPEVVYAVMHRQEVFQPYKSHPRFHELLENIYTVLDFFNTRMDAQRVDGDWSVSEVLQVIIVNCRSWRGDGMKMFTQLRFMYEQERHPEEFFIPYVWQLVLSHCGFTFNAEAITLFPVDLHSEKLENGVEGSTFQNGDFDKPEYQLDP
ncbi:putative dymeclin [Medicago truncatula]|uniref:Dymeclin n=1 Tax=Medicago truncatula TaxID=3880 RepID=A0A072W0G2_MEDTR|nr:dymeclin [Medicago truncatula]KEH43790.1 dyggve-melchior-clausen syndrome protein [Medicago truncatula]RHN81961.1 putative dymeclin [Medicago truncatula]